MTRIGWVRVEVGWDAAPLCHVIGTTHRRLVTRRISLGQATALIASGVPSVVRQPAERRPEPVHS